MLWFGDHRAALERLDRESIHIECGLWAQDDQPAVEEAWRKIAEHSTLSNDLVAVVAIEDKTPRLVKILDIAAVRREQREKRENRHAV